MVHASFWYSEKMQKGIVCGGWIGLVLAMVGLIVWCAAFRGKTDVVVPVICTADALECPNGQYVGRTGPKCEFDCGPVTFGDNSADIHVTAPVELATVSSPLLITGSADGVWFYENTFSVELLDRAGYQIATGTAEATAPIVFGQDIPFKTVLTFSVPTSTDSNGSRGELYLYKDNPAHLRGLAGFYRVSVRFK